MLSEFRKKILFNNVFSLFLADLKPLKFSLLFKPLIFHYFFVTLKSHKEFFNQLMIKCELLLFGSFSTLRGKLPRVLTKVLAIIIYLQYLISTHFTKYRDSSKLNVILWLRVLGLVTQGTLRGRKLGKSIALVQDVLPDTVRRGWIYSFCSPTSPYPCQGKAFKPY